MAAFAGKMVAKKVLQGGKDKKNESDDPYFDKVPAKRMGVSYMKKQQRAFHPDLNAEEIEILTKVRKRAYQLDMALFNLPLVGRFGWSSVIGLVPAIGDILDSLLAWWVITTCCSIKPGLPPKVVSRMYSNLVFDFVIGLVPFLGDIADAIYKCNTKNFILFEKELVKRAKQRKRESGIAPHPAPEPEYDHDEDAYEEEVTVEAPSGPPPRYASTKKPNRPEPAYGPRQSQGRGGYFGGRQEVDLEAGEGAASQQPSMGGPSISHHQDSRSVRR